VDAPPAKLPVRANKVSVVDGQSWSRNPMRLPTFSPA
jgi:hypothetical protein